MKRIYQLSLFLFSMICVSYSQVETHRYKKGELVDGLRKSMLLNRAVKQMPPFDLSKELEKSKKMQEKGVFQFGKGFDVSYSLDGQTVTEKISGTSPEYWNGPANLRLS